MSDYSVIFYAILTFPGMLIELFNRTHALSAPPVATGSDHFLIYQVMKTVTSILFALILWFPATIEIGYSDAKMDSAKKERLLTQSPLKRKHRVMYKHKVTDYKKTFYIT